MANSSGGRKLILRAHSLPTSHLLSTWTLRGGVTRSTISMDQVWLALFSETAVFVKNSAHLKPIKYGLLPFGAYFKGWSDVSSQMLLSQTDRQKTHYIIWKALEQVLTLSVHNYNYYLLRTHKMEFAWAVVMFLHYISGYQDEQIINIEKEVLYISLIFQLQILLFIPYSWM